MLTKLNITYKKKQIIVYIVLILATLTVYWQVHQFNFVNMDDEIYVTENSHVQAGVRLDGFLWAFSNIYGNKFWYPVTWLSFMVDYQLYGLNAGGYHVTNLILHILSSLLLFWLFNLMTKEIWKSAFVAAVFALHPLHVESVAWIAERKDVLSAFFWMLTLCMYVYYTEKPAVKRYLLIVFSYILALMSKPMVVTLPVIMILLDYWPLKRFESRKDNLILWQLKEKIPFFILSAVLVIITLVAQHDPTVKIFSLSSRLSNASVSFVDYLYKTFLPHNLAVFYPYATQIPLWQTLGAIFLIIIISATIIVMVKKLPYLFVGWFWFAVAIAPVIGIVQSGDQAMADRFHYLPSIGITIMLAWGFSNLIKSENIRKTVLIPATIVFLIIMSVLTWQQCGYWKNSITLFEHALKVTKDSYMVRGNLGVALYEKGELEKALYNLNKAIQLKPDNAILYDNRGGAYAELGLYQYAFDDFNKAINLKPDYSGSYICRGVVYNKIGRYDLAIEDFNKAINLKPDYAAYYNYRGNAYSGLGQYKLAIEDFNKAISIKPDFSDAYNERGAICLKVGQYKQAAEDFNMAINLNPAAMKSYNNRGILYANLGQHQMAIEDFNKAIILKEDYATAYNNRAFIYLKLGDNINGCRDAQKACELKNCKTLEIAKNKGYCP